MSIPKVREWKITMHRIGNPGAAGDVFRVLGPTKRLAIMNLRYTGNYEAIRSVAAYRKQVGQTALVQKESK
ncbi:MAG: hypothetical protein OEM51_01745 [Gammaproteobacteria bacterium]|nr:hypothetical protein [Gammaproteobacteria bacterium]